MDLERRKHFRFDMKMPARLRAVGLKDAGAVRCQVADLSAGGARLVLDRLPDWSADQVMDYGARFDLEVTLGRFGRGNLRSSVVRMGQGQAGPSMGVRFRDLDPSEKERLHGFLNHMLRDEADEDVRKRYRRHSRRRRRRQVITATLAGITVIALTICVLNLAEAAPGWWGALTTRARQEAREITSDAIEAEVRRIRESGMDPRKVYEQLSPAEKEFLQSLPPDEKARLRRLVEDAD